MYKRFLLMAKPWWKNMIVTIISLLVVSVLNLVTPELIQQMTALLSTEGALTYKAVILFMVALALSYIVRAFFRFLSMWQAHVAAWSFVADTTLKVFGKLEELPMTFYSTHSTGEIMSRTINDTRNLETMIAHAVPDLLSGIVVVVLVTVRIFLINPVLAALTLIPVPLTILVSTQFSTKVKPLFRRNQAVLASLNGHLQDRISGIKEIKAFGKEKAEYCSMKDFAKLYASVNIRANFANGIYQPTVEGIISMGTAIVMGVGGTLVLRDKLTTADIVGFFVYLSMFYTPLSALGRIVEDIQNAWAGGVRVMQLLDTETENTDTEKSLTLEKAQGEIRFEEVEFSYQNGEKVLDGVSFTARPGQMIAIVGATGAGKTTVISLLERFYRPQRGKICLDGIDIQDLTLSSLRKNLSLVLQDVFLFNGTVYENIAYGKENATEEEVKAAARLAHCDEFIADLPLGFQTELGERGTRLSGGQKQRIAIARAVLRKTPVLILDEATSAVDNETEAEIQKSIESILGTSTVIVIAHRLSTVMKADNILVLQDGKVCEEGNFETLKAQGGIFARMCNVNDMKLN